MGWIIPIISPIIPQLLHWARSAISTVHETLTAAGTVVLCLLRQSAQIVFCCSESVVLWIIEGYIPTALQIYDQPSLPSVTV